MFWKVFLAAVLAFVGGCAAPLNQLDELWDAHEAAMERSNSMSQLAEKARVRWNEAEAEFHDLSERAAEALKASQSARRAYVAELKRVGEQELAELTAAQREAEEKIRLTCKDYPDLCVDPQAAPAASDPAGAQPAAQQGVITVVDFVDIELNPRKRSYKLLTGMPKGWEFNFEKDGRAWYLVLSVDGTEARWHHLGTERLSSCWRFWEKAKPVSIFCPSKS